MAKAKQPLKQGEKILFGIIIAFIGVCFIAYVAMETIRLTTDKPMFASKTHYDFSEEGKKGSILYRKGRCSSCHRAMGSGTSMGLSLDGLGSRRSRDWIYTFLTDPESAYEGEHNTVTLDHGSGKEAGYVADMPDEDLQLIAAFLSGLRAERGASAAPLPPEGRSEFIDEMIGTWAPEGWKEKYKDVRSSDKQNEIMGEGQRNE